MTDQLKQLSEAATQGEWLVGAKDAGTDERYLDGPHFSICKLHHHCVGAIENEMEANAAFICALVNAYRAGELVSASEARAQVAVAYEVAADELAKWSEPDVKLDHSLTDEMAAIRALVPDHTTTALEQIKQQARDEAFQIVRSVVEMHGDWNPGTVRDDLLMNIDMAKTDAILATLSADTQENSDE